VLSGSLTSTSIPVTVELRDLSFLLSDAETELAVSCTERGNERRHASIPFQSTEAFDGFEDTGGDPPEHHLPSSPALDVALHVTRAAEETLRGVGGRQGSPQTSRQVQCEHRQRFVESFAHALGRAGMLGLQGPREIQQQPLGRLDVGALVGASQDRLRPRRWRSLRYSRMLRVLWT